MRLARPIVASEVEQPGEVIVDGETGLLCPPGDASAAAAAIRRLLHDPCCADAQPMPRSSAR
jgi:glycogen(starch) synthase